MFQPTEHSAARRAPTNREQHEEKNRTEAASGAGPGAGSFGSGLHHLSAPALPESSVLASPALPLPDQVRFKQYSVELDYTIDWGQELGVGASGFVRKALSLSSGKPFAVKFLTDSAAARQEIACWATCLPHPHVLPITDVYECEMTIHGEYLSRHWLAVVSPLMEGGELYYEVIKRKKLPESDVRLIAYQLLHAVAHVHLKGVCHRDVKLENVLLQRPDSLHVCVCVCVCVCVYVCVCVCVCQVHPLTQRRCGSQTLGSLQACWVSRPNSHCSMLRRRFCAASSLAKCVCVCVCVSE
jgi:hypothetical protein